MTVAMISTLPSTGTVVAVGNRVITVPVGASKGTLSHDEAIRRPMAAKTRGADRRRGERGFRVSIGSAKDNTLMRLQGQDVERGYAMAALLVSLAVMSVLMSVALPTWRHAAQREKEAELVFRGEQYARAVALYRAKNANAFPPSIDVLVQGKYLRKKYLDPITKKEFDVIGVGAQAGAGQPSSPNGGRGAGGGQTAGPGRAGPGRGSQPQVPQQQGGAPGAVTAGIMGVHSKSTDDSIRIYNGQTRYDQWNFVFTALNRPGGNMPGAAAPGGPGGAQTPGGRPTGGQGPGQGTGPGAGRGRVRAADRSRAPAPAAAPVPSTSRLRHRRRLSADGTAAAADCRPSRFPAAVPPFDDRPGSSADKSTRRSS